MQQSPVNWVVQAVERGLVRAYAERLETAPDNAAAYAAIDHILEEAKALGRRQAVVHVNASRFGDELIVLVDGDAEFDWVLPAVRGRLLEASSKLGGFDTEASQQVDLSKGQKLRFLDCEFRCTKTGDGSLRVSYKQAEKRSGDASVVDEVEAKAGVAVTQESSRPAPRAEFARGACGLLFGRVAEFIGRLSLPRRATLATWQSSFGTIDAVFVALKRRQFTWRDTPLLAGIVLGMVFGWWTWPVAVCAGLLLVFHWRTVLAVPPAILGIIDARLPGLGRKLHRVGMPAAICLLLAFACALLLARDVQSTLRDLPPRERAVADDIPGFLVGEYVCADGETANCGLYMPPHFKDQTGPFPMLVFLHGYGERDTPNFKIGLAGSIHGWVQQTGRFDFVAFFPLDPTGRWTPGTPTVTRSMEVLERVIRRHKIDPARVCLTGHSVGGSGVWRMADGFHDKWAAIAPVAAMPKADAKQLPCWIFNGAVDKMIKVERVRERVAQLRRAGGEVRYTEFPNDGHISWQKVYAMKELFEWFGEKKK